MSWKAAEMTGGEWKPKIDYIYDGIKVVDARIYFGKFCQDKNVGVLLSEIVEEKSGKGYIRWLRDDFEKATDELVEACEEILGYYG
jgi:hypothetical protein